jgi:hypothetical protein
MGKINAYLATDEMYLVTETPAILNTAIVKIPRKTKKSNTSSEYS